MTHIVIVAQIVLFVTEDKRNVFKIDSRVSNLTNEAVPEAIRAFSLLITSWIKNKSKQI